MTTQLNFQAEPFSGYEASSASSTEAEYSGHPQSRSHAGGSSRGGYRQGGGRQGFNSPSSRSLGRQVASPRAPGRTLRMQPGRGTQSGRSMQPGRNWNQTVGSGPGVSRR